MYCCSLELHRQSPQWLSLYITSYVRLEGSSLYVIRKSLLRTNRSCLAGESYCIRVLAAYVSSSTNQTCVSHDLTGVVVRLRP